MDQKDKMPFGKKNYTIMLSAIGLLILGFVIMSLDTKQFGFGLLGLTLGPIVIISGFLVGLVAILYNPHKSE